MMRKTRWEKAAETFGCSRQEKHAVLAVCIVLVVVTCLLRYGRLAWGHRSKPRGKAEICTVPSVQDGWEDRLTPLRDRIFPADSADFSVSPDKRAAPMPGRE